MSLLVPAYVSIGQVLYDTVNMTPWLSLNKGLCGANEVKGALFRVKFQFIVHMPESTVVEVIHSK